MFGNLAKFKDKFNASEQKSDDQLIQYGVQDCYKICDQRHPGSDLGSFMLRNACAFGCRSTNWDAPEHPSQESTPTDIGNTLRDIGNNFYSLADSLPDLI